jgi:putative transposase
VAVGGKIEIVKTPDGAPKANAICERFLGSVWRECLDHMLVLGGETLGSGDQRIHEYFNQARPHQGIEQKISEGAESERKEERKGRVIAFPVLNGLLMTIGVRPKAA